MKKTVLLTALVAGALVFTAGCATDESLQGQINDQNDRIENLEAGVDNAEDKALEALETAREAQADADSNSEAIERAFKTSQSK